MVHKSDYIESGGIPIVNPMNIIDGCIVKEKLAMVSPQKAHELARYTLQKNDILIARRGDLSKCAIVNEQSSGWLCGTGSFFLHIPFVEPQYIMLFYLSEYVQTILKRECVGATMENLNQGVLGNIPLLLPPIKKKKRIIQKVRTLETSVFNIDSGRQEVRQLISQVKSKILELAISGKLVPQDRADEPAADLLKRVNPNAVVSTDTSHYDLPDSYCVVTLKDICKIISAKPFQIAQKQIQSKGKYPVVSQSANFIEGYTDSGCAYKIKTPIILFGDHTRNVKFIDFDFVVGADGTKLLLPLVLPQYVYLSTIYASNTIQNRGYSRHFSYLCKVSIPLPPLNEQKRIVAKVDELFALIDTIQQSLE